MSATSERGLPAATPSPLWAHPIPGPAGAADDATPVAHLDGVLEDIDEVLDEIGGQVDGQVDGEVDGEAEAPADTDTDTRAGVEADAQAEAASDEEADAELDDELDGEVDAEVDEDAAERNRFAELVEERVRRARYAHHLTRTVFTPTEAATAVIVERRAAIWVPTLTFVATLVSAVAAVVLATRLRGDPADPTGHQLLVVIITVGLLAAAFGILLRAEVHYERLRPRGRTVRHDVADAYEVVRDAPRRLVRHDVPLDVLRRVSDLLPAAEQLVDGLVAYVAEGGQRVREHPAYERIVRMRAEVEAIEVMLAEREEQDLEERLGRQPRVSDTRTAYDGAPLPRPEQVPDYTGLEDLAATLESED